MSDKENYTLKEIFSDRISILLPYPSTIVDLKIRGVNIYPKIISKDSIILYGDYDILLLYRLDSRQYASRYFYRMSKSTFQKSFNISKLSSDSFLSEDELAISLQARPVIDYTLQARRIPAYRYRYFNICSIEVSAPLSISLNNTDNSSEDYPDKNDSNNEPLAEDYPDKNDSSNEPLAEDYPDKDCSSNKPSADDYPAKDDSSKEPPAEVDSGISLIAPDLLQDSSNVKMESIQENKYLESSLHDDSNYDSNDDRNDDSHDNNDDIIDFHDLINCQPQVDNRSFSAENQSSSIKNNDVSLNIEDKTDSSIINIDNKMNNSDGCSSYIKKSTFSKIVEVKHVIGNGCKDIFISESIKIDDSLPLIWKINNIDHSVCLSDVAITEEKVFISGYVNINIIYSSTSGSSPDYKAGALYFLDKSVPFSSYLDIKKSECVKLSASDSYRIIDADVLSETHKLSDSSCKDITLYNMLEERMIIRINLLILRSSIFDLKETIDKSV